MAERAGGGDVDQFPVCDICGFSWPKQGLAAHKRSCKGKIVCHVVGCGKEFVKLIHLHEHKRMDHPDSPIKKKKKKSDCDAGKKKRAEDAARRQAGAEKERTTPLSRKGAARPSAKVLRFANTDEQTPKKAPQPPSAPKKRRSQGEAAKFIINEAEASDDSQDDDYEEEEDEYNLSDSFIDDGSIESSPEGRGRKRRAPNYTADSSPDVHHRKRRRPTYREYEKMVVDNARNYARLKAQAARLRKKISEKQKGRRQKGVLPKGGGKLSPASKRQLGKAVTPVVSSDDSVSPQPADISEGSGRDKSSDEEEEEEEEVAGPSVQKPRPFRKRDTGSGAGKKPITPRPSTSHADEQERQPSDRQIRGEKRKLQQFRHRWSEFAATGVLHRGRFLDVYNFKLVSGKPDEICYYLRLLFGKLPKASYTISVGLALELQNVITREFRYYYSSENTLIVHRAAFSNLAQLTNVCRLVKGIDFEKIGRAAEVDKNVIIWFSASNTALRLPRSLMSMEARSTYSLICSLCYVKCHEIRSAIRQAKTTALQLFNEYYNLPSATSDIRLQIALHFDVFVEVLAINEESVLVTKEGINEDGRIFVQLLWHNQTYNYIKDYSALIRSRHYCCRFCSSFLVDVKKRNRHEDKCRWKIQTQHKIGEPVAPPTELRYMDGPYRSRKTIVQQLRNLGVEVNVEDFTLRSFCLFDVETISTRPDVHQAMDVVEVTDDLHICKLLKPYLLVVSSVNEARDGQMITEFFDARSPDYLHQFISFLLQEQALAMAAAGKRLEGYFSMLHRRMDIDYQKKQMHLYKAARKVLLELYQLQNRLIVQGYNNRAFDIKILRQDGLFHLLQKFDGPLEILKKHNHYLKLTTTSLCFTDIMSYLAHKCSLDQFLKSFGADVTERKQQFPYSLLTAKGLLMPLADVRLSHFDNSISGCNDLAFEHEQYMRQVESEEDVSLPANPPPPTGEENLLALRSLWQNKGLTTVDDLLRYYAQVDVEAPCKAVLAMAQHFASLGMPLLFQVYPTLPSAALPYLIENAEGEVDVYHIDQWLHQLIENNLRGGLTTIFHRHAKVDVTKIPESGKLLKSIEVFDCNSMYPTVLENGDQMVGMWSVREKKDSFARNRLKQNTSLLWLAYCSIIHKRRIQTAALGGEGRVFVPVDDRAQSTDCQKYRCYRVDGKSYTSDRQLAIYEFDLCGRSGGHGYCVDCQEITDEQADQIRPFGGPKSLLQLRTETEERRKIIERNVSEMHVMKSCQFEKMLADKSNTLLQRLQSEFNLGGYTSAATYESEAALLDEVETSDLFGMIQCDVALKEEYYDTYDEYPPVCRHHTFESADELSPFMRTYLRQTKERFSKRRLLVSGFYAKQQLFSTDVIQYYLKSGHFNVNNVTLVVEFKPGRPFSSLISSLAQQRRDADAAGRTALASCIKSLLNSAYGSAAKNKRRLTVTQLMTTDQVRRVVHDPFYTDVVDLGNGGPSVKDEDSDSTQRLYETTRRKRSALYNVPLQIAFQTLELSKLHLLQFHRDFISYFIEQGDRQTLYY